LHHFSSSSHGAVTIFFLPFSNAIVVERKGSFFHAVAVSSLHHWSAVTPASSIVVVVEVVESPPLSSFNPAYRHLLFLFLIMKPYYGFRTSMCVSKSWFGSLWFNRWWFHVFRSDMVVKKGCFALPKRWMEVLWSRSSVMWWSKMVVMAHWRHLRFEWWLGFLIWEKVEDEDVAHYGWCKCVYKDHGCVMLLLGQKVLLRTSSGFALETSNWVHHLT